MKRKREVAIILGAFKCAGLVADEAVEKAIISGLKQVRNEKYHDRHKNDKKKGEADEQSWRI